MLIRLARQIAYRGEANRQSDGQLGPFYRNERANHIESDCHRLGRLLAMECSFAVASGLWLLASYCNHRLTASCRDDLFWSLR